MDDQDKTILLLALIIAIVFYAGQAHAQTTGPAMPPSSASAQVTAADANANELAAMHEIHAAARRLERAALQWDFSSNAEELALLQSAHDWLAPAIRRLCCAQRARVVQLESDIDFVMARAGAQSGPLQSTTGASSGPPAPTRDQLAQLAVEAQDLGRNAPIAHRLIDTDKRNLTGRKTSDGQPAPAPDPMDYANTDFYSWPPGQPETSPQFHFRF